MITVKLMGGLGNQLFQYALGRSIEINAPGQVQFDNSWLRGNVTRTYLLTELGLKPRLGSGGWGRIISESSLRYNPSILELKTGDNVYLQGYWQCERYFERVKNEIRSEVFRGMHLGDGTKQMAECIQRSPASALLHVRRSDNLSHRAIAFHGLLGLDYFRAAANYIRVQAPDVQFFIFSDDPQWCHENMQEFNATVVDCNPMSGTPEPNGHIERGRVGREVEDLYLMSLCQHGIIANSTFSWWGTWLSQREGKEPRTIVAPKAWFAVGPEQADSTDIIPDRWVRV
jgi:hypothetical protein